MIIVTIKTAAIIIVILIVIIALILIVIIADVILGLRSSALYANLSASKRNVQKYSANAQFIKDKLLDLVDKDAKAFDFVMKAFSLKKKTKDQQKKRSKEIEKAYKKAIQPPLEILEFSNNLFYMIKMIQKDINSNCLSDLGVAIEMASASSSGAIMNININLKEIKDKKFKNEISKKVEKLSNKNDQFLFNINKMSSI